VKPGDLPFERGSPADKDTPPLFPFEDGFGRGGFGLGTGGTFGMPLSGRTLWIPSQPVAGQAARLGSVREEGALRLPVWTAPCDSLFFTTSLRGTFIQTDAVLPDTRQPFPTELYDVRFGLQYQHRFDNGWTLGGGFNVGSASDRPFNSINEITAGLNVFLRVPQGERNAWLFSLTYSPLSEIPFPIPGVAFLWQPCDELRLIIGVPFQVFWRPIEQLSFDATYMPLTTVRGRVSWHFSKQLRAYVSFDRGNESYLLADRLDSRDRFYYYDTRLTSGVEWRIRDWLTLDLSGGYVFDRYYFEGRSFSDHGNRVDVGDGPFVALRYGFRW
jgi:hypothetical protein